MPDDPDLELLERWRAGDKQAGAALYSRHFMGVRSYFVTRVPEAQEDLIQDTFLALIQARDRFRGDSLFKTYLFRIARYTYTTYLRKHCRPDRAIDPASESIADLGKRRPSSVLAEREHLRLLLDALRSVPIDDQDLLELYFFEDLTGDQLAAIFEVPIGTLRSRIGAAKQRLAKQFGVLANQPHDREWNDEFTAWMSEVAVAVRQGRVLDEKEPP